MKIDRKFRKALSEIPNDCKQLIEKLKNCVDNDQLLNEICNIKSWNIGKCELYHWADVLDRFNSILEAACAKVPDQSSWQLACDLPENAKLKMLLLAVLQFTALLIEHSYSRHLYNSIEHLTTLLISIDFHVILSVLNLLYVFSKRSIFINRLSSDKKQALLQRLLYLAESWGGKENGLDLVKCCCYTDLSNFPASATAVNFEYTVDNSTSTAGTATSDPSNVTGTPTSTTLGFSLTGHKTIVTKHVRLEKVHLLHENPAVIMERVLKEHDIPEDKRVLLYTYIRLAHSFPNYEKRKLFVQTRLQSLSILVYSGAIQEHANNLLYDGLIEELVDLLTVKDTTLPMPPIPPFPEIKAASLKTLTAIIHLEKTNKLTEIIETTQAASYHGLLPTLVRKCVDHLIDPTKEPFPHQFATSLFSFLYHLATYDTGGDALVKCGIMETLLKVVNHNHNSQEFIMFVTRAVRVIDLITNLDMSSFEAHSGLTAFINRLEYEVNECRKEQPFVIQVKSSVVNHIDEVHVDQEAVEIMNIVPVTDATTSEETPVESKNTIAENQQPSTKTAGLTCYHQRSALLKSILNFFKKAIADSSNNSVPNLGDSIRHMMEHSLPDSLKHIISNADYYGASLFLLSTDVVQLFIFQEPSQLSSLQENGLTDVILYALLKKNVPATREVLGSLPTVFSALCLNTNGLNAFIESKPFDKLFQVLLSPDYLPAMKRRRNADQVSGAQALSGQNSSSGTASQLGSAMDELMRHQPSLRIEAINSIIKLLNQLIEIGRNPNYVCQRQSSSSSSSSKLSSATATSSSSRPGQADSGFDNSRRRSSSSRLITLTPTPIQQQQASSVQLSSTPPVNTENSNQQAGGSDEEEFDNTGMIVDTDTLAPVVVSGTDVVPEAQPATASTVVQEPVKPTVPVQLETIPLLDYITNIMKFVEAILSNNSTDDHCKEFVKQKGLVPLLQILCLPNLPIDFPSSMACQSVAQVCKAILHLAREPLVIDQALNSLAEALAKCESLYTDYKKTDSKTTPGTTLPDGSVLIRELAQAENPLDAINCPQQMPLLHSICSIHSFIYLLITLGKINQNDVRNLTISKWGSELGTKVLNDLCKLYMNLIWESSMLLWLCNEEQQQHQLHQLQQFYQLQLQQLSQMTTSSSSSSADQTNSPTNQLAQLIQQFSTTSPTTAASHPTNTPTNTTANNGNNPNFKFNRSDLDRLRSYLATSTALPSSQLLPVPPPPPPATTTATIASVSSTSADSEPQAVEKMETTTDSVASTPATGSTTTTTATAEKSSAPPTVQFQSIVSYSKLLRPLFNCSSKLGRSLCELFGLLVKLSAGSPWKNTNARRNMIHHLQNNLNNPTPSVSAVNVATAIANISISGFSNQRFSTFCTTNGAPEKPMTFTSDSQNYIETLNPKFRLTFYICSLGFASSILFDEQKRPYHLMLQRFDQSGGLRSLFDAFKWAVSLLNGSSQDAAELNQMTSTDRDKLQEGTLEFIEAWLQLIQKLVNTKNMLETRHSLNPSSSNTASSAAMMASLTGEMKKVCSFDPIKFLLKIHKESFQALMSLWDNKSFIIRENYSLSETVLNILCQILVGDSQLQKKLAEQQQAQSVPGTVTASGTTTTSNTGSTTSNVASSLRASIQNVRDARAQFLAAMQDVNSSLPQPTTATSANAQQPAASASNTAGATTPSRALTATDQDIISQMVTMGFSTELAQEAVLRSPPDSLEQAVEYCFNHPANTQTLAGAATTTTTVTAPSTTETPGDMLTGIRTALASNDPDLARPVIEQQNSMSMLESSSTTSITNVTDTASSGASNLEQMPEAASSTDSKVSEMPEAPEEEAVQQLDKQILDKFANTMLPGLMKILDNVPDTVYRVCELIVVVVRKYGDSWRDDTLLFVLEEICDLIKQVCVIHKKTPAGQEDMVQETFNTNKTGKASRMDEDCESKQAAKPAPTATNTIFLEQKLASRLLLFCLLFEEMQLPCAKIVNASNLLDKLVSMLEMVTVTSFNPTTKATTTISKKATTTSSTKATTTSSTKATRTSTSTPVWLTSLFILIDLIEKAALATKRKALINEQFGNQHRQWKWYEERQNRWILYGHTQNKQIDAAYINGDTSLRIVVSRKHYIIHFNLMLQENEETLHKRPIMLTFEQKPTGSSTTGSAVAGQQPMNTEQPVDTGSEVVATSQSNSRPSSPLPTEVVNGLQSAQKCSVIKSCVELISWPVSDPDCLHAILRLILRITRQYEYAIEFAAHRGPQHILSLTQRNSFMGYASLITLIFRHICEDENNLRLTMEKAIRLALSGSQVNIAGLQPGGIGTRELHNVMRLLGPAICRDPELFSKVASDILRIIIRREDETFINLNQPISRPLSNNTAYCLRTVLAKLMPPTPMPDYARVLVIDLLNYLIKPIQEPSNLKPILKTDRDSVNPQSTKTTEAPVASTSTSSSKAPTKSSLPTPASSSQQHNQAQQNQQPLISKSGVLRILSELVRSYAGCAKIITQHIYKAADFNSQTPIGSDMDASSTNSQQTGSNATPVITEDSNALAFLLDNLLASNQTFGDKDCPSLCRLLIVALASCNHCLDSQNALVHEVKLALNRAISLPESNDKHIKIQAFASIINTMIETCPPIQNVQQQQNGLRNQNQPNLVNNMMKIMHKKSLINDLARVPHHMDLSCLKCIETLNTLLKPLETMTKTLNISSRKRNELMSATKNAVDSRGSTRPGAAGTNRPEVTATAAGETTTLATTGATSGSATTPNSTQTTSQSRSETSGSRSRRSGGGTTTGASNNNTSASRTSTSSVLTAGQTASSLLPEEIAQHTSVTSDVASLNIGSSESGNQGEQSASQAPAAAGTSARTTAGNMSGTDAALNSSVTSQGNDEQMIDLNMTEMEPQQTLPQDIDMLPSSHLHHHHHHHRNRDLDDHVFDRVIEALEDESSDSDSEYDDQNRHIIHIEGDNDGDQIHIQIEHGDEDEDDEDEDVDTENEVGLGHDTHTNGSSGEDDSEHDSEDEDLNRELGNTYGSEVDTNNENGNDGHPEIIDESDSDSDDDDDDESVTDDDDSDDEDGDEDEEIVEGSDGRSAENTDMSDDEHHRHDSESASATANATNVASDGGVVTTTDGASSSGEGNGCRGHRRRHRHHDIEVVEEDDEDDVEDEDEDDDEDQDDEDMDLDEENEIDEEIIEEDENDEVNFENDEDNEDEDEDEEDEDEDEDDEENEEDEEDAASEYYDAYNQMLDFIDDDNGETGEEDDLLTHIENLWQNHGGNANNHIVLGHQLNIGNQANRGYQISVLGGGGVLGQGVGGSDGSLPPHPLSVSAVHPLLIHHSDSLQTASGSSSSNTMSSGQQNNNNSGIQITSMNSNASNNIVSAISPILRTIRHNFQVQHQNQQSQQQQARPQRVQLQQQSFASQQPIQGGITGPAPTSTGAIGQQAIVAAAAAAAAAALPNIRSAPLPYSTLNEILQGIETPAAALQPSSTPSIITAPTATSFIDLLTGAGMASSQANQQPGHGQTGGLHHHHHPSNVLGNSNSNNALASLNNQEFLVNLNSYNNDGFGENIGNGTTNLYIIRTPLARWNEECTVLDSHSMHHAILLHKPKIMEALENYRNEELNEKREKKLKEEQEKQEKQEKEEKERQKKLATQAAASTESTTATVAGEGTSATPAASGATIVAIAPAESEMVVEPSISVTETTAVVTTEEPGQPQQQQQTELHIEEVPAASTTLESSEQASMMVVVNPSAADNSQPPATEMTEVAAAATNQTEVAYPQYDLQLIMNARAAEGTAETVPGSTSAPAVTRTTEPSTPGATAAGTTRTPSPFATPAEREAATNFLINFVGATTSVFSVTSPEESRIAQEALRMAEQQRGALELQAAAENPATTYPQNYVLLDGHVVELPAGIDPSFLGALPDSLRKEVIMEQLRNQGIDIRNRPIPASAVPAATASADNNNTTTNAPGAASASNATASAAAAAASNAEINPEFLAALPPQIQEELLAQQRIEQQARAAAVQNAATAAAGTTAPNSTTAAATAPATSTALATTTNTTADDDNTAFMRALPASLRQAILFDMDHSQISALPEDLATEARNLQQQHREREIDLFAHAAAHRSSGAGGAGGSSGGPYLGGRYTLSTNRGLGSIYNVASSLLHDTYLYGGGPSGLGHSRDLSRLRRGLRRFNEAEIILGGGHHHHHHPHGQPVAIDKLSRGGRQLLDHESLACLLVLLFIDDTRMNTVKLHRVIRNLCIHGPSRSWIIKALLSILEKVSGKQEDQIRHAHGNHHEMDGSRHGHGKGSKATKSPGSSASTALSTTATSSNSSLVASQPSWLTMSIDGAFGSKTNVFTINKPFQKKSTPGKTLTIEHSSGSSITINLQACPAIFKQILEILSTLARAANFNFFPRYPFSKHHTQQAATTSKTVAQNSQFWDLVVKLDQFKNKSSKLTSQLSVPGQKGTNSTNELYELESELEFSVENSPLARLMSMLDYPVLKNNAQLMDKMFTCLAHASAGIPLITAEATQIPPQANNPSQQSTGSDQSNQPQRNASGSTSATITDPPQQQVDDQPQNMPVLGKQIELVVNVLKNKLCTQDGLQQAYTLLSNLSKINSATRSMIIKHLLCGTRELGLAVCKEIELLMDEAITFNAANATSEAQPGTSALSDEKMEGISSQAPAAAAAAPSPSSFMQSRPPTTATHQHQQQNLIDSYSNLVISSPKTKQTGELQLPSMSLLVEKNSNQKFFVRLIRLIINLRETIEKEHKKKKHQLQQQQAQQQATATPVPTGTTAATPVETPVTATGVASTPAPMDAAASTSAVAPESVENDTTTSKEPTTDANKPAESLPGMPNPLEPLSIELDLDILWNKLSQCLTVLKSLSDPYAVLILQQTVEAFFYVHATRKDKEETRKKEKETREAQLSHLDTESQPMSPTGLPSSDSSKLTSQTSLQQQEDEIATIIASIGSETSIDTKRFLEFALTHRVVLNHILRQTSNNLSDEPYSVLVDFTRLHTHILDFDVKRRYFRQELDKLKDSIRGDDLAVHVRRTNVFDDSFRELNRRSIDDWKHRFYIVFEGEEGQDAGGLLREWYMIISQEIFNPGYALFMINPGDRVTYMPNPASHCNPNHLSYFKFIGHIIAKAIFDNKFLDCYFTRAFYKHILGVAVKYTDMESVDNEFFKNLCLILESDIETFGLDLYFCIDINEFGITQSRDLKPNGKNIKVTNENKTEYVRLVCQEKMIGSIRQQVSSFLQGFYEIIPKNLISIFNEQELELLISGLPEIDLEDLRRNTEYHKYTSNSLQIQWFWRALKSFDKEDLAKFLQFVTGTSKVPLAGFSKLEGMNGPQKFQIHRDDRDTSRLPCAHTCFNQLDLPAYENFEKLRTMLLMAIRECSTGFGLA